MACCSDSCECCGELREYSPKVDKREEDWRNLSILYRRKLARYRNQIVILGAKPSADEKIDAEIFKFQKKLSCEPNLITNWPMKDIKND